MRAMARYFQFIQEDQSFDAFKADLLDWARTMSNKGWVKLGKMFIK